MGAENRGHAARGREGKRSWLVPLGAPHRVGILPSDEGWCQGVVLKFVHKSCPGGGGSARLLHSRRGAGGDILSRRQHPKQRTAEFCRPEQGHPQNPRLFHHVPVPHRCPVPARCPRYSPGSAHTAAPAAPRSRRPWCRRSAPRRPVPVPLPVPAAAAAPPGPRGAGPGHCPGEGSAALRLRRQRPAPAAPGTGTGGAGCAVPGWVRGNPAGNSVLWRDPVRRGLCPGWHPSAPEGTTGEVKSWRG